MKSLFDNPRAFAPFYADSIAVEGSRSGRTLKTGPLPACVFDQGLDDPISDSGTSSTRRRYTINVPVSEWPETTRPQTGDVITLSDGSRLSVMSVAVVMGDFAMEARSC